MKASKLTKPTKCWFQMLFYFSPFLWGNDPIWPQFVQVEKTPAPGAKVLFLWWASHGSVQVVRIISELFDKFDVPCATSDGCVGRWVGGFLGQGKIRNGQFVGGFQPKFVGIMLWLVRFCSRKEWENYGDTPSCFFLGISWDACFLGFSRLIPSFFANHLFLSRCGSIWM